MGPEMGPFSPAVFTITVENTGNVDLTGVVLTDTFAGGAVLTSGDDGDLILETDETWTYTADYTVTQADLNAGSDLVNVATVDTDHRERTQGRSNYTLAKLISLWLNGFTAFSVKPLRLATIAGCGFAFFGVLYTLYIVVMKFLSPGVPVGYSSMMAALLIIGGLIMTMLGLIGEYVGRIYMNINNIPQYVVRDTLNVARPDTDCASRAAEGE